MQVTKKTLILTSADGVVGMATLAHVNNAVSFTVSLPSAVGYKVVIRGDREYVVQTISPRATFLLPYFALDNVGVAIYADGKLFCKGGKDFSEEVKESEKFEDDAEDESEKYEDKEEQKEERVTYADEAVAEENYYPKDVKLVCEDGKNKAVLLSARINGFIENRTEGLFNCKIARKKEKEKSEPRRVFASGFTKKPFDYDEVASTVYPLESTVFSRRAYYYEQIKDRVDALFGMGVRERELERLMPDTRWVRIEYSSVAYYVVGVIGGIRGMPDYICYGVPSEFSDQPPLFLGKDARWVPVSVRQPQGKGYWLLFQSAKSGETVSEDR